MCHHSMVPFVIVIPPMVVELAFWLRLRCQTMFFDCTLMSGQVLGQRTCATIRRLLGLVHIFLGTWEHMFHCWMCMLVYIYIDNTEHD